MVDRVKIAEHYGDGSLTERLQAAIATEGLENCALSVENLAPLDHFHSRGLAATVDLARLLKIDSTSRILDIGSGLGGPSRYLAKNYGCMVEGVDLSQSFVDAARFLARATGLTDKVMYRQADALALPFAEEMFDIAWTQHVAMNIADRTTLYREAYRVLRRGGRLGIYDVVEGSGAPLHFPVPWASTSDSSFLITAECMQRQLIEQGFRVQAWEDCTQEGIAWFDEFERLPDQPLLFPRLGLQVVMGPKFPAMTRNLFRNLREGKALSLIHI